MLNLRTKLVTVAAVGAAAVGGAAISSAATSSTTATTPAAASTAAAAKSQFDPSRGGHTVDGKTESLLTGDVAAKVQAAALAKVPGTVERVETNVDGSAPYEAHVEQADGTEVEVQIKSDYSVAAVNAMGGQHP